MKPATKRPERIAEITDWLRKGKVRPDEAFRLAMELRQRQVETGSERAARERSVREGEAGRAARVAAVLAELDGLVGLTTVKQHVREIHAYRTIQAKRAAVGLSHEATGLHMVFTGSPGTGKTTVARLLGRLFKEMGVLSQGHLVEVERADLVGEYIGHTALKTREVVKRASGGLLFIDEAYSLARGGEKDFGRESIDCLVRAMEEQRGDLVIIFAGYSDEMDWFLSQNPGLHSRLPLRIQFPDYTQEELLAIAEIMWQKREYQLSADARLLMRHVLGQPYWGATEGNARAVRNLVERSLRCQALRLVKQPECSREQLMQIERPDLEAALQAERSPRWWSDPRG